jgi:hypothetical protein
MRLTPYIQQCMRELEQSKEYESDQLLVAYVRMQNLVDRIAQVNSQGDTEEEMSIPRAPRSAYTSAFQAELDKIRNNMPKSVRNSSEHPRLSANHPCILRADGLQS